MGYEVDMRRNAGAEAMVLHDDIDVLPPGARAGDRQRLRAIEHLNNMQGEGFITADEAERRIAHAAAATTYRELEGLVADLPPVPLTRVEARRAASRSRQPLTATQARIIRSWAGLLVFAVAGELVAVQGWGGPRHSHVPAAVMITVVAVVAVVWLIINASWTADHWASGD